MDTLVLILESWGRASLAVWWLPLAVWSAAAALGFGLLRRWRSAHPHVQMLSHQALLFALPLAFLMAALFPFQPPYTPVAAFAPAPQPTMLPSTTPPQVQPLTSAPAEASPTVAFVQPDTAWGYVLLGGLMVLAITAACLLLLRLTAQGFAIRRYARARPHHFDHTVHRRIADLSETLGIRRPVRVLQGTAADVPMTFGWLHPTIILPPVVMDDAEALDLTLRHELAHIARHDYAWNLAEECVTRVFAMTPVAALLRSRIDQYREAVCDHTVLSSPGTSLRRYASLLLSFQRITPRHGVHALRMAQPGEDLKQRIETMQSFRHIPLSRSLNIQRLRVAVALLLLPMLLTACHIDFSAFTSDDEDLADKVERLELEVAYLKDRIGNTTDPVRQSTLSGMYHEAIYEYEALRMQMEIDAQLDRREVVQVKRQVISEGEQALRDLERHILEVRNAMETTSAELFEFYVGTPEAQQNPAAHPYALERTQRMEQLERELQVLRERHVRYAAEQEDQSRAAVAYQQSVAQATLTNVHQQRPVVSEAEQALLMAHATILNKQVETLQSRIAEIEMGLLEMETRSPELNEAQQVYLHSRTQQADKLRAQMEALVMQLAEIDDKFRRN